MSLFGVYHCFAELDELGDVALLLSAELVYQLYNVIEQRILHGIDSEHVRGTSVKLRP